MPPVLARLSAVSFVGPLWRAFFMDAPVYKLLALLLAAALLAACGDAPPPSLAAQLALPETRLLNREAPIPSQCYTRTDGHANPCWTCHTRANGGNLKNDAGLQEQYAFSPTGLNNHWTNLQVDRRPQMAAISDAAVLAYIRQDNYRPLYQAGRKAPRPQGYTPDLDYALGFDIQGFARDGSGWRAFIYKPFPGTFWPSNGATDDIAIRLPLAFRQDAQGHASLAVYRANLALIEAALTVADTVSDAQLRRKIEPINEAELGTDLNGDGHLGRITELHGLPPHYLGAASAVPLHRYSYPLGTEFLHSVRYIDPAAANLLSARFKELRYSIKRLDYSPQNTALAYQEQREEKGAAKLPWFRGSAETGLMNAFGWQYQGFIEDAQGQLRLQSYEEHYNCMGCHGGLGITADSSFGYPRKRPGAAGWGWQTLQGQRDTPQAGHAKGEVLTYFERVGGGDEFRANTELLGRYFMNGQVKLAAVLAAPDLAALITPSPARALALNKAYWALVKTQTFRLGRDTVLAPAHNVLSTVRNGDTQLKAAGRTYNDGRIWLDWAQ